MKTVLIQSYCGDTYERWTTDSGRTGFRRIKKAASPDWAPPPRILSQEEVVAQLRAERDRYKALADGLNETAKGAFLDGRRNALEEAAQLMEIQSPHLFCDPDDMAGKIRALAGNESCADTKETVLGRFNS